MKEESFRTKLFSDNEPNRSWGVEQFSEYAQAQHDAIVKAEQSLAPIYWRLGQCLTLARKQLGRGHWGRYLDSIGIHKVRACKARAIYRAFSTSEAVAGLSVEEAYDRRPRIHRSSSPQATQQMANATTQYENDTDSIELFLGEVCMRAEALIDEVAFANSKRRSQLVPVFRQALQGLQSLGKLLGAEDASKTPEIHK